MASAGRARITSWLCRSGTRIAPNLVARLPAAAGANVAAAARAHRARRQLCLLLSVAVAFVRLATDCPLTALPPPPKCSGNEEGAKMTGSISDFASRTCASTTVPRELALGAGSSGVIRVSTATSSSAATAIAEVSARSKAREGAKMTSSIFVVASRERPAKRYCPLFRCCPCRCHSRARTLRLLHSQVSV